MRTVMFFAALFLAAPAFASGLIIPDDTDVPPLALRSHRVTTEINQQGAETQIEQVFENNTARQLEARFVFPIPRGAAISKFTMLVNGVEKTGELVEKAQARKIYNAIVRRAQDPGLLEYLGNDLFQANIFPILPNSTQRIAIRYIEVLSREGEFVAYRFPLRAGAKAAAEVRDAFRMEVKIASKKPLRSIYSPSHSVLVTRPTETGAVVTFEQKRARLEKDFVLYYATGEQGVGLNLVAQRAEGAKQGTFMLLVSPKSKLQDQEIVKRDFVFVVDHSHSMEGEKMAQAQDALRYCIKNLHDEDRFTIVSFSTDVDTWKDRLVPAKEGREAALRFVDGIEATGGTNIDGALKAALSFSDGDAARPCIVVFMTDGKPTIGATTDGRQIVRNLTHGQSEASRRLRLFTWGVGYDVDTHLLDRLAEFGAGVSEYVRPDEDIAQKLAAFYHKASKPVLTGLKLDVLGEKVQLAQVYPKRLPDLYAGAQLVVLGKYAGEGPVALRLRGEVNGREESFTYEMDFPAAERKHAFVEPLWAQRRIGHLLDDIRLHGEQHELVQETIQLSREFGIQTPYTSYLVLEDGMRVPGAPPADRPALLSLREDKKAEAGLRALAQAAARSAAPAAEGHDAVGGAFGPRDEFAADRERLARDLSLGFKEKDGARGVEVADYLRKLKTAGTTPNESGLAAPVQRAAGTRFFHLHGIWADERYDGSAKITKVKFASEAYFALLDRRPGLAEAFQLGKAVLLVTAKGKALLIGETGQETLSAEEIAGLF